MPEPPFDLLVLRVIFYAMRVHAVGHAWADFDGRPGRGGGLAASFASVLAIGRTRTRKMGLTAHCGVRGSRRCWRHCR